MGHCQSFKKGFGFSFGFTGRSSPGTRASGSIFFITGNRPGAAFGTGAEGCGLFAETPGAILASSPFIEFAMADILVAMRVEELGG